MKRRLRAALTAAVLAATSAAVVTGSGVASAAPTAAAAAIDVTVPITTLGAMALDEEYGHVFLGGLECGLYAVSTSGGAPQAIAVTGGVTGLAVDPATDSLFVGLPSVISVIDTSTLTVRTTFPLADNVCPRSMVV